MKIWGVLLAVAALPTPAFAAEPACTPQSVTITGFPRPTLGIFAADGVYTDKEIPTKEINLAAVKVCDWNKERNLIRLLFADRDIWVDPTELLLKLGDKPQADDRLACADAPSKPTGTQSLASMGVNGSNCKK